MRLDQFLSARTMYSRRELRQMIQKGKATVDGAVVRKADQHVQPDENTVCLNGRHIPGDQYLYVLLHKPKGYVSSADEPGQKSVLELVPPELCRKDLRPVGRLDKDSTGMLLLTDDGQLAHQVIAARSHVAKYYHIVLARPWEDGKGCPGGRHRPGGADLSARGKISPGAADVCGGWKSCGRAGEDRHGRTGNAPGSGNWHVLCAV